MNLNPETIEAMGKQLLAIAATAGVSNNTVVGVETVLELMKIGTQLNNILKEIKSGGTEEGGVDVWSHISKNAAEALAEYQDSLPTT